MSPRMVLPYYAGLFSLRGIDQPAWIRAALDICEVRSTSVVDVYLFYLAGLSGDRQATKEGRLFPSEKVRCQGLSRYSLLPAQPFLLLARACVYMMFHISWGLFMICQLFMVEASGRAACTVWWMLKKGIHGATSSCTACCKVPSWAWSLNVIDWPVTDLAPAASAHHDQLSDRSMTYDASWPARYMPWGLHICIYTPGWAMLGSYYSA